MKAIVHMQYGPADLLRLQDVEKPTPQDNEVLVKIHATAVNPLDWRTMRADPFLARLENGLFKPKNPTLGADIAGVVEAVGSNVTQFKVGDAVYGSNFQRGLGGFADYVCMNEAVLVPKPASISFEAAASVPVAGLTALQGLRDNGKIQAGQKVLINGASGGVGTFAVQIAKAFGAHVTGVCSSRNVELVRSLGADHVIDYTQSDFTQSGEQYDLIYDAVGNYGIGDYQRALTPNGKAVVAGFSALGRLVQLALVGMVVSKTGSQQIGMLGNVKISQDDLKFMNTLLESGKVVPVLDKQYPLSETAAAIGYVEKKHARGKVVVTVASGNA